MRRNQIAKLPQDTQFGCGWFGVSFYHLCRVAELKTHANHFFLCFSQNSCGMAVFEIRRILYALGWQASRRRRLIEWGGV